ncbi:hypothetical protein AVEN_52865-1 [Araneus ventricosus]|uniref:Uncharacterized protein n=1 Tax=Araneus ventricosus TaxID=182803 RepID=A0A4Y2PBY1_ARAVE|nr:hypothetical protein AVEN_52865-1 [Araneus ventricosus]
MVQRFLVWIKVSVSGPEDSGFENQFRQRCTVNVCLLHVKSEIEVQISTKYRCGVEVWRGKYLLTDVVLVILLVETSSTRTALPVESGLQQNGGNAYNDTKQF